jgi:DNA-binding Xre family transcriptional regulator
MIALSAPLPRSAAFSPVEAFGNAAISLRERTLRRLGVSLADMTSGAQKGPAMAARKEVAFLLWTECQHLSLSDVAKMIGRRDHSAAIHCILAGARARGISAARVSDLRDGAGDDIDWTKLAYQAAGYRETQGLTLDKAARRAGLSRAEWRKVENGHSVSAASVLKICRTLAIDPIGLLPVTRETPVKHGGES